MKRRQQREWVFKLIYQDAINEIMDINSLLEAHKINTDEKFIVDSLKSYKENFDKIEDKLDLNLTASRHKLSKVIRSIIYLSINEIYFMDIPVSVSINEAVDLAKKFSDEDDYKLVNRVLGNIVRNDKQ